MHLKIIRHKKSYSYKINQSKDDSFQNNWANNSLDNFILLKNNTELFRCKCQSVANYCFGEMATADTVQYGDSLSVGSFIIRCFVSPRNFHGEIHAITQTRDIDGQWIDHNAMQTTARGFQNGRWLIHDRYSFRLGRDTTFAWSAGCIILSSVDLKTFNDRLKYHGINAGDELFANLIEKE